MSELLTVDKWGEIHLAGFFYNNTSPQPVNELSRNKKSNFYFICYFKTVKSVLKHKGLEISHL